MSQTANILLVEDDKSISSSLRTILEQAGYRVHVEPRGDSGLSRAKEEKFDLIVTDFRLPGLGGIDLVRQMRQANPKLPILLMTAHGTADTAIEAMKQGAYDYLVKPFDISEFLDIVAKAVASSRLMSKPVEVGAVKDDSHDAIVGNSRAMQTIYKEIGRVAAKPVTVLIRGETGTGKELVARALYQHSERALAPFIAVNCAAIPANLLESELFGHERGAFTGAESRRIGKFEQASRGTLFLDEIGDLSPDTQAKLLRVLQEKCIQRVGGQESIPVDVRIIAATHQNLEQAIHDNRFREDLFYRLNVVTITIPPLRERLEDVPVLVEYFLSKHAESLAAPAPSIQKDALDLLREHSWPGNVRELENVIRKAMLKARGFSITRSIIEEAVTPEQRPRDELNTDLRKYIADTLNAVRRGEQQNAHSLITDAVEHELFSQAIEMAHGNQSKAAQWLGVSRITMREKLQKFGLHPKTSAEE